MRGLGSPRHRGSSGPAVDNPTLSYLLRRISHSAVQKSRRRQKKAFLTIGDICRKNHGHCAPIPPATLQCKSDHVGSPN
ncbi:hypothetical protein SprV_0301344900 [Sparganum proliferum]